MSEDDCDNDNCDNGPNMFLTMCPLWSLTGDKLHISIGIHTSLEATLRKIKLFKQSANAGVSQKPIQKFWDVSQLFWMGDFGDIPQKPIFL